MPELVAEILEDLAQGQTHWAKLFKRLGPFFKEKLAYCGKNRNRNFPKTYY